jgi:hypothetical protein
MNEVVPYSTVLIAPLAFADAADALSIALGYAEPGSVTYGNRLLTNGVDTHRGTHTWASARFIGMLQDAQNGVFPEEAASFDPAQLQALMASLIISVREGGEPLDHWNDVLAANGLTPFTEDDE